MRKIIVFIPDTVDSFEFLEAAETFQLPLLLLIKEKWLKKLQSFPWDYLIIKDFKDMENIALSIQEFLSKKSSENKVWDCIAFSESNIELMGYLNTCFITEGLNKNQAELFRDKYLMKVKAKSLGLSTPLFASYKERSAFYKELQKICHSKQKQFAFLIKPRKGWACQGIEKFFSIEEAEKYTLTLESPEDYLFEEFLEADLFHVGGLVTHGRTVLSVVMKYAPPPFELGRSSPEHAAIYTINQNSEEAICLKNTHDVLVKGFGLKEGFTFIEFFKELNGQISLCEAAARHSALSVPKLYEIVTKKNFFKEYARALSIRLTGAMPVYYPLIKESCIYAGFIHFAALPGKLIKVDSIDRFNHAEIVHKSQPNNLLGMIFKDFSFKNTIGQIFIKTKTESHCQNLLQTYCREFKYQTIPPEEI
ncbi:MAG: ATP-grasp domain-containing protein [Candidatus Rhabdochlamydia sp.]